MRGKLLIVVFDLSYRRITPACAGKTPHLRVSRQSAQDHPRVCGENGAVEDVIQLTEGSPPRVRGKQRRKHDAPPKGGITPACAGKTE